MPGEIFRIDIGIPEPLDLDAVPLFQLLCHLINESRSDPLFPDPDGGLHLLHVGLTGCVFHVFLFTGNLIFCLQERHVITTFP